MANIPPPDGLERTRVIVPIGGHILARGSDQIAVLKMVLVKDGLIALQRTVDHIRELRQLRPPAPPTGGIILADPQIPQLLNDLCTQLGQACLLLFNDGPDRNAESKSDGQMRRERAATIRNACHGIDTAPLTDRKTRNRLVHVDEYLLKQSRAHQGSWLVDMAISSRSFIVTLPGESAYCRVYVSDEDKIYHLGSELDLAAVETAANEVLDCFELGNPQLAVRASRKR